MVVNDLPVAARLFAASDLPAMYAIEEACFAPPLRFSRRLIRSLANDPNCRTWVGLAGQLQAGFAIVSLAGEDDSSSAYIWTIEVLPAYRRRGVARQLLERLEQNACEAGCSVIELHVSVRNLEGITLYVSAGYELIGVQRSYYGPGEDGLHLRKTLRAKT